MMGCHSFGLVSRVHLLELSLPNLSHSGKLALGSLDTAESKPLIEIATGLGCELSSKFVSLDSNLNPSTKCQFSGMVG